MPASNVVFVRSRDERAIAAEKAELLKACWPVHQAVIDSLGVDTIICLGNTAGAWVRQQVAADERFDSYQETNSRGWTSEAHRNRQGLAVVTVSHPGRQNWQSAHSDPSELVLRVLQSKKQPTSTATTGVTRDRPAETDLGIASVTPVATKAVNDDWRAAHLRHLHNGDGKAAYNALARAESLGLRASPNSGAIRAVRLHDQTDRYLFSYIVNKGGLLFYVRKPALNSYPGLGPSFAKAFAEARQNAAGEWTLAIADARVADRVVDWLQFAYSG